MCRSRFGNLIATIDVVSIEREAERIDEVINDLIDEYQDEGFDLNADSFETARVTCFSKDGRRVEFIEFDR